jgi:hypothetical protein
LNTIMKTNKMRFEEVAVSHPGDRLLRRLRKRRNIFVVIYRKIVRFVMAIIHNQA